MNECQISLYYLHMDWILRHDIYSMKDKNIVFEMFIDG